MRTIEIRWMILLLAAGLLPAACLFGGRGGAPAARFYKLESLRELDTGWKERATLAEISIAVGPVWLAEYLDRPQILTAEAANELSVNEFERWAEPLKSGITRVIIDNLALLLNTNRVAAATSPAFPKADYQVAIDISRFDGSPGSQVRLQSRWRIIRSGSNLLQAGHEAVLEEPWPGADFSSLVKAQSRLLGRLSREIAQAIEGASRS